MNGAPLLRGEIRGLVTDLVPVDAPEEEHRRQTLDWLDRTGDIFRRVKPRTPDPHLVSYFLLTDLRHDAVLLVDHRKAGLWLPTGGHVEPGERSLACEDAWPSPGPDRTSALRDWRSAVEETDPGYPPTNRRDVRS